MSLSSALKYIHAGIDLEHEVVVVDDGQGPRIAQWTSSLRRPTDAEIAAAMLPAAKHARIAAINAECRGRLIARYGTAEEQVSRLAGIYGEAERAAMHAGIAATIDAANVAQNAILAATTEAQAEAVTATWPAI